MSRITSRITLLGLLAVAACGPGMAPSGVVVTVRRPPPNRVEARTGAPGSGYVWIPGHYSWQGGDYIWMSGRWEAPPQPRYRRWVSGHWSNSRTGWFWVEGHWQ